MTTTDENGIVEGEKAVLPLDLPTLYKKHGYKILRNTPFGCNLTFDIAKAAIEGENLGRNTDTDLADHQLLQHRLHRTSGGRERHRNRRLLSQIR